MSRTLALFTIVALALSGLSSAAPLDSNSLASPIEKSVSFNVDLEKRKKHHGDHGRDRKHRHSKKRRTSTSTKKTTTKKTSTSTKKSSTSTKKSSTSTKKSSTSTKKTSTSTKKTSTSTKKTSTSTKKSSTTSKKTTTTKQSSSGGSSSSGTYTGTATWFKPASEGGSQGACGPEEDDDSYIVALNAPQYGNMSKKSPWCGKKVRITGPKGSVTAVVNDACPGCSHGDLDLTPILFKQVVGDMNIGVAKISWYEV
ncbi:hypothetical protein MFLAVUS_006173 [Mucor flavus]|uniref:RlpA-like protein double-psi beta-barrel domain-containing protein n=1 Tax=Mucor flavus TaxID=439312 RepID=A0ABP9Z0T3_9FUNG